MTRVFLLAILVSFSACKTPTVESRKTERSDAYSKLSSEDRVLVDRGQVGVGMTPDAVYIAWGKPDQVLHSGSAEGVYETWLYQGSTLKRRHSWQFREAQDQNGRVFFVRSFEPDYYSQEYIKAEIRFFEGKVKDWKTLGSPLNNEPGRY